MLPTTIEQMRSIEKSDLLMSGWIAPNGDWYMTEAGDHFETELSRMTKTINTWQAKFERAGHGLKHHTNCACCQQYEYPHKALLGLYDFQDGVEAGACSEVTE